MKLLSSYQLKTMSATNCHRHTELVIRVATLLVIIAVTVATAITVFVVTGITIITFYRTPVGMMFPPAFMWMGEVAGVTM